MAKAVGIIVGLLCIWVFGLAYVPISQTITQNYTFANYTLAANLTQYQWIPAFTRSLPWIIPLILLLAIILYMMRKEQPTMQPYPTYTVPRQPRQPRQPKKVQKKQGKQPPANPPIFFGR
jgi:hypothetical protein